MNTRLRLILSGALALLLLTCTVAAWAHPQAPANATATASACDWIAGPAHGSCTGRPAAPAIVAGTATPAVAEPAAAGMLPVGLGGRGGLLLFATAAIAGAVGLILTAERRSR
ncbi:hypothetical protein ACFCV9_26290 [Streptomyces sp. NPDC056367]|uniref:hypothetical protein n=1 Tax=Streptomyces sp. NPDC056367 TaxID=3345797 RepID=UPI0035DEC242